MLRQALPGYLLPGSPGTAVIAVRVDADAATGQEFPPHLNVFRVHGMDQVVHDDVDTVFVEVPVIAETKQIELQRFAFYHPLVRYIRNIQSSVIGLSRLGAETGKFGTVELDEIVPAGMFINKRFQQ